MDVSQQEQVGIYAQGWGDLMELVRDGHSWSGGERNRFFLNEGGGAFAEVSGLSGLDHADDGRGLALVDWDQDGDLDLWYRNRTAPRLRVMLNQSEGNESVALRLEGVGANRDGIGAVVELLGLGEGRRLVRSVRAGDLFLSQSSKWLHFGLGDEDEVRGAEVLWPGGERERFAGVRRGGRFLLKQGSGEAMEWASKVKRVTPLVLKEEDLVPRKDSGAARILLPARLPMPKIAYRNMAAKPSVLQQSGRPTLVVLWSAGCSHCEAELKSLGKAKQELGKVGLQVVGLSVDGMAGPTADLSAAYSMMDEAKWPYLWGFIEERSLQDIFGFQKRLFDRTPRSSVPMAILLDGDFNVGAIYRGRLGVPELLEDLQVVQLADDHQLFHLAPPLAGRWFTNPLKREEAVRMFAR